jgi:hypothetical protein
VPRNFFAGWTLGELLDERRAIQERLSTGAITEASVAGVRTVYKHESDARDALNRVEYALYLLDPDEYDNPYASVVTQTRPAFHTLTPNG